MLPIGLQRQEDSPPFNTAPGASSLEGAALVAAQAEGRDFWGFGDPDRLDPLDQEIPPAIHKRLGPDDPGEGSDGVEVRIFGQGFRGLCIHRKGEEKMVVAGQDVPGEFLVPGFENVQRQESAGEDHRTGQGEEGQMGW
jgi:hypothetical protein